MTISRFNQKRKRVIAKIAISEIRRLARLRLSRFRNFIHTWYSVEDPPTESVLARHEQYKLYTKDPFKYPDPELDSKAIND